MNIGQSFLLHENFTVYTSLNEDSSYWRHTIKMWTSNRFTAEWNPSLRMQWLMMRRTVNCLEWLGNNARIVTGFWVNLFINLFISKSIYSFIYIVFKIFKRIFNDNPKLLLPSVIFAYFLLYVTKLSCSPISNDIFWNLLFFEISLSIPYSEIEISFFVYFVRKLCRNLGCSWSIDFLFSYDIF